MLPPPPVEAGGSPASYPWRRSLLAPVALCATDAEGAGQARGPPHVHAPAACAWCRILRAVPAAGRRRTHPSDRHHPVPRRALLVGGPEIIADGSMLRTHDLSAVFSDSVSHVVSAICQLCSRSVPQECRTPLLRSVPNQMKRKHHKQLDLPLKLRGGRRPNAGRKSKTSRPRVSHARRARFSAHEPVLITTRLSNALPSLRCNAARKALNRAFAAGCDRCGFRLIHYSIQSNHLHLLVEAKNRGALTRGVQGLMVRIARCLNRLWSRRGKVFADRYHDRILRSPRQVRNALVYVLQNAKKHRRKLKGLIDAFSSARWFDGWRERLRFTGPEPSPAPVASARTWLLDQGWRRHGLISSSAAPRSPG